MSLDSPSAHPDSEAYETSADDQPSSSTLPIPLTSFIGRETEVRNLLALLDHDEIRMLTLMGPGGVGKTRLGIEVALHLEPDFADGVAYIPLASVHDPQQIVHAVAKGLAVHERGDRPLIDSLETALRDRHLLLGQEDHLPLQAVLPEQVTPDLTPRELEVPRLLANGMTNKQIADVLFNSRSTIANHVSHILAKLDVDSRTAALSYAIRHGIV